jgi:hypothetical protein
MLRQSRPIRHIGVGFPSVGSAAAPALSSDTETAHAGYYRLSWQWPGDGTPNFELQESQDAGFSQPRTIYQGPDLASLISGRSNGTYYYRIRARVRGGGATAWSDPVKVVVVHQPLDRAIAFFSVGAVVFLATLGLVVGGNLANARRGGGNKNG